MAEPVLDVNEDNSDDGEVVDDLDEQGERERLMLEACMASLQSPLYHLGWGCHSQIACQMPTCVSLVLTFCSAWFTYS